MIIKLIKKLFKSTAPNVKSDKFLKLEEMGHTDDIVDAVMVERGEKPENPNNPIKVKRVGSVTKEDRRNNKIDQILD